MQPGNAAWGFRETPLEQQLAITRKLGLNLLEIGIAGHENDRLQTGATDADIAGVRSLFERYGVALTCASTGNDFTQSDKTGCLADLEKVKEVLSIASRLGVRQLRIFAGFSPAAKVVGKRWERMICCLNAAAEEARMRGIMLAVETHGGVENIPGGIVHFHSTSTQPGLLTRWLGEVSPEVGILFDPANLGAVGMPESEILALYNALLPRIAAFHLKDFKQSGASALQPCACGEGQLHWGVLWPEFRRFPGPGLVEYELTGDIEDGLKRTLQFLESPEATL